MKISWGAVVLAVSLAAACGSPQSKYLLDNVERTGNAARDRPGARQVADYAQAIHSAYTGDVYAKNPAAGEARATEALEMLSTAEATYSDAAPSLVAWRGVLLTDIGSYDEAWAELERSFAMRPTFLSAGNMVLVFGAGNLPNKVAETCATAVPFMTDPVERFDLIELCVDNMNALDENAALAWAAPEDVEFYRAERRNRSVEREEAAKQRAERERYEQQVVRDMEVCSGRCKEKGHVCLNDCYGDTACEDNCVQANHACLDQCEARAYKSLEQ
jgi:hypothetical protein